MDASLTFAFLSLARSYWPGPGSSEFSIFMSLQLGTLLWKTELDCSSIQVNYSYFTVKFFTRGKLLRSVERVIVHGPRYIISYRESFSLAFTNKNCLAFGFNNIRVRLISSWTWGITFLPCISIFRQLFYWYRRPYFLLLFVSFYFQDSLSNAFFLLLHCFFNGIFYVVKRILLVPFGQVHIRTWARVWCSGCFLFSP